jgi:hypothetical protein
VKYTITATMPYSANSSLKVLRMREPSVLS